MPLIWLLLGQKTGDNVQALQLAHALGLPFETKRLVLKPEFETAKPRVAASLEHLDRAKSDALAAPWPDLVITIGRRMAMAGLWIKEQSGGKTRLVLIGAPKGCAAAIDLIIAPIQYQVGKQPNVCRIGLPLLAVDAKRLEAARARWADAFATLPRPLTVFLLGGSMGSKPLGENTALGWLQQIAAIQGTSGTIFVSTSRRTPEPVAAAVHAGLPGNGKLYRWHAGDTDNPYLGLLAHGDRFVVSGDSISMLVEVARLGKPTAIARDEDRPGLLSRLGLGRAARSRDFALLHDYLIDGGWAVPLGKSFPAPSAPPPDDTAIAAQRVLALLG